MRLGPVQLKKDDGVRSHYKMCVTKQLVCLYNFQLRTLTFKNEETQKEHNFTVDGLINGGGRLYPGGLIFGIIYSFENGWGEA